MERRDFIKKVGGFALGTIVLGDILSNNYIKAQGTNSKEILKMFPENELRQALTSHFNKFLNGDFLRLDELNVPFERIKIQKIFMCNGFEINIIKQKNTVFDVADIVIEKADKWLNFDAKDLKKGIIPEGMSISAGSVSSDRGILTINELKNYDADVILKNPLIIHSPLVINEWGNIESLKKVDFGILKNKKTGENLNNPIIAYSETGEINRDSKIIIKRKGDEKIQLNVKAIKPCVVIDSIMPNFVSQEKGLTFFNEQLRNFIQTNIIKL